jgi:hypothetical protein
VAKNAPLQTELLQPVCRTLDVSLRGTMSTPVSRNLPVVKCLYEETGVEDYKPW